MPKIIVIAKSHGEAYSEAGQESILHLQDDFIEFAYNRLKDEKKKYPEMYRLFYDEHACCAFFFEDLPRMRKESTNLLNDRTTPNSVREILKKLLNITETAISENKSLFAEAD